MNTFQNFNNPSNEPRDGIRVHTPSQSAPVRNPEPPKQRKNPWSWLILLALAGIALFLGIKYLAPNVKNNDSAPAQNPFEKQFQDATNEVNKKMTERFNQLQTNVNYIGTVKSLSQNEIIINDEKGGETNVALTRDTEYVRFTESSQEASVVKNKAVTLVYKDEGSSRVVNEVISGVDVSLSGLAALKPADGRKTVYGTIESIDGNTLTLKSTARSLTYDLSKASYFSGKKITAAEITEGTKVEIQTGPAIAAAAAGENTDSGIAAVRVVAK